MHVILKIWFAMERQFYYTCVTVATYVSEKKKKRNSLVVIENFHVLKKVSFY